MTAVPAKVAGVSERVGTIAPGKDADLVVFSKDPLRLDAKVLEVYVRGVRVYCAAHQEKFLAGGCP
jgi:imidazolonepropionase-like amidohydrolase